MPRRARRSTRPMPASPARRASPASSRPPTACRCCSPRRDGRAVARRTRAGAALSAGVVEAAVDAVCAGRPVRAGRRRRLARRLHRPGCVRGRRRRADRVRRRPGPRQALGAGRFKAQGRRQVACRPARAGARPAGGGRRGANRRRRAGAPSPTRHGSSRTGATASPAGWPPRSGSPRADASARRRAARRDGVPTR